MSFTFSRGSQSLSIDNAVLGYIPKCILFTIVKNKEFLASLDMNPFRFPHINYFALYVNGKQMPRPASGHWPRKDVCVAYRTLFDASGIHHSNSGLQISYDMYVAGYFMLLFDLTPDRGASEGHTSHLDSGNIRIELKFKKALTDAIPCLLYLQYNYVRVVSSRIVTTDFS